MILVRIWEENVPFVIENYHSFFEVKCDVWWDNSSYLYNEFHIILIQLLWPTHLSYSVCLTCVCPSNSCSETICPQPTITLLQKHNGRNYSAITILHQSKRRLCSTQHDLRDGWERDIKTCPGWSHQFVILCHPVNQRATSSQRPKLYFY